MLRITRLIACTLSVAGAGCAMTSHGAQQPPRWEAAQGTLEEQYERHKVVCEGDWLRTCVQDKTRKTYDAMGPVFAQYPESNEVNDRVAVRQGVLYTIFGTSIGATLLGLSAPGFYEYEGVMPREAAIAQLSLFGAALVSLLAGVVVMRTWDPAKGADDAYNAALWRDLEEAYATGSATAEFDRSRQASHASP